MEHGYRKLEVWEYSRKLANSVYDVTKSFPREEIYGLNGQIRRAAISVPSNIAEGHERHGKKEFIQFIGIARGSLAELETQLIIASDQKYIPEDKLNEILNLSGRVAKMLWGLRKSLEKQP